MNRLRFKPYAVVMGDLVGSEAQDAAVLHNRFNAAIEVANAHQADALLSPLTITLGDEFQGLTASLDAAFRIAVHLRHALLADDVRCRFVVGRVRIETPINRERAWNMMGEGLADARDLLNHKHNAGLYRFSLPHTLPLAATLDALGEAMTRVERGWTTRQRDALLALEVNSVADVANAWGTSARNIYKLREAGQHDPYRRYRGAISGMLAALDRQAGVG